MSSDRERILGALRSISGYVIGPGCGSTVSSGWSEIAEIAENELDDVDAGFPCVFWTEHADRGCFDAAGALVAPLALHWRGDASALATALARTGLVIAGGDEPSRTFVVEPQAPASGPWVEVPASRIAVGDVVKSPRGLATVAEVTADRAEIAIELTCGGGFLPTWHCHPDEPISRRS